MEITRTNFQDKLAEIQTAIENCTFISIDCEFTGLKTASNHINAFDTPKQYYEKVVTDCREFLAVQYGLTLFRYDEKNDVIKHKSYNFYLFQRPVKYFIEDQRFLCQASCMDFLANHDFDFNKLFKEGISYLNDVEENAYRTKLAEFQNKKQVQQKFDVIAIPEEHQEFIDNIVAKLEAFVKTEDSELELPKCNSFLRRLIYQTHQEKFIDKLILETRLVDNDRILFALRVESSKQKEDIEQKKFDEMLKSLEEAIGFSKVIRKIIESEKLVVGHNLLLDFLHTIHKFVTPLSDDYITFKECAHSLFPKILDTKYLCSTDNFKALIPSSILANLLNSILEKPFQLPKYEIEQGCLGYEVNDNKQHDAGYDSFITGLSMVGLWKYLGSKKLLSNADIFGNTGSKLLNPYMNKIFTLFLADNQYINLGGQDLNPSRDHVFYLTFPKEWSTNTIQQLFSPFGGVRVAMITEASAFVALIKKEQAAIALKSLSLNDSYSIMTFAKRNAILSGLRSIAASPIKRKSTESIPNIKRRKVGSLDGGSFSKSKRSIEPIEEEPLEPEVENTSNKGMFEEEDNWD